MMKLTRFQIVCTVVIIFIIISIVVYLRRPRIKIIPDWDKKTFRFEIGVGGCSFEGIKSMDDYGTALDRNVETKKCNGYEFEVYNDAAFIWKEGKFSALKAFNIDPKLKQVTEVSAGRPTT